MFKATRDAEWFKRTIENIEKTKQELDDKFLSEEQRLKKLDFIRKLQNKVKDYKDAQKNAELYKKIRFFERKKLEKEMKRINKLIQEKGINDDILKLKEKCQDNINYVKYFPLTFKYYSLFPKNDVNNEVTELKRTKMRNKIKIYLNTKRNKSFREGKKDVKTYDYEDSNLKNNIKKDDFFEFDSDN